MAKVSITADDGTAPQTAVDMISGTAATLTTGGLSGATLTPTWSGALVAHATIAVILGAIEPEEEIPEPEPDPEPPPLRMIPYF